MDAVELATQDDPARVLALDEALRELEARDPRMAQLVKLRFYAGLSDAEVASAPCISDRHVRREWTFARAWLQRALAGEGERAL